MPEPLTNEQGDTSPVVPDAPMLRHQLVPLTRANLYTYRGGLESDPPIQRVDVEAARQMVSAIDALRARISEFDAAVEQASALIGSEYRNAGVIVAAMDWQKQRIEELERAARVWYDGDGNPVELDSAEEVTRRRIESARELGKALVADATAGEVPCARCLELEREADHDISAMTIRSLRERLDEARSEVERLRKQVDVMRSYWNEYLAASEGSPDTDHDRWVREWLHRTAQEQEANDAE